MKNYIKIIRNLIIFLILIVVTFYLIFRKQNISDVKNILFSIDIKYLFIGFLAMIGYVLFESINIRNVLKTLGNKVSIFNTLRYTLTGFFFSGITPAASGGQPMEIYFMHKDGIPVAHGTVALLVELISFQIIIISSCIIGAIINPNLLSNGVIYLFLAGITLNSIALIIMLICFISEKLAKKIVDLFLEILKLFKYKKVEAKRESIYNTLNSYAESSKLIKDNKMIFVKSLFLVFLQMYIYYTIPYWVYRAFGLNNMSIIEIVFTQSLLYASVSSIPLPGAVGISESAFISIYGRIFGETLLTSATLLNRFINFYSFIIIAFIVVIYSIIKEKKKDKYEIEEYNNISNPEELISFMNKYIIYGLHGTDDVDYIYDETKEKSEMFHYAAINNYALASPEYLLQYHLGHCFDQVELERDWFNKNNYEFKTNFIWFELDYENSYTCHTYLIYKDKKTDKYALFEHADYDNRGIHKFKTYNEAVQWQYEKHLEYNKKQGNNIDDEIKNTIHIYEYNKPKYGINFEEFIDHVTNGKDITSIIKRG